MFNHIISAILLCLLILPISCGLKKINEQTPTVNAALEREKQELLGLAANYSKEMNSKKLDSEVVVENFISGEKKRIGDLLKAGDICVLQYSELNCNICVDSAVTRFKQFIDEIGNEHAIIIAATQNPRYMVSFVKLNKLQHDNVYMIDYTGYEKLYGKSENKPFVYLTNSNFKIADCFFPIKEIPEFSDIYYNTMHKKYFEGKLIK